MIKLKIDIFLFYVSYEISKYYINLFEYYSVFGQKMGNCCSCIDDGKMMITIKTRDGKTYNALVCARCHRGNHSSNGCYASTYSDGSSIKPKFYDRD